MPLAPNTLPARAFQRTTRTSRLLFYWRAADYSLTPVTGETPTFVRASLGGYGRDALGFYRGSPQYAPRFESVGLNAGTGLYEVPGLLLEPTRTNILLNNRDCNNASWTKANITTAKTQTGVDGQPNSCALLTASAGNGTCLQAVTLGSSQRFVSAFVKRVTGAGTIQMTGNGGTGWTTVTVTTEWTRVSIPAATVTNPSTGFRIVTNGDAIAVDFVQNEGGAYATSPLEVTTPAFARAADILSWPFLAPPQAMTVYGKFTCRDTTDQFLLSVCNAGVTAARLQLSTATSFNVLKHHNGTTEVSSTGSVTPAQGDTVEVRAVLAADGSVTFAQTVNAGSEVVAAASAANALAAAWGATTLWLGSLGGSTPSSNLWHALKVAAGVQTLAVMREMS